MNERKAVKSPASSLWWQSISVMNIWWRSLCSTFKSTPSTKRKKPYIFPPPRTFALAGFSFELSKKWPAFNSGSWEFLPSFWKITVRFISTLPFPFILLNESFERRTMAIVIRFSDCTWYYITMAKTKP